MENTIDLGPHQGGSWFCEKPLTSGLVTGTDTRYIFCTVYNLESEIIMLWGSKKLGNYLN